MPPDIRNFFGGKAGATAPKQEKPLGTKDNVCALFPLVILCFATPCSVTGIQCPKMTNQKSNKLYCPTLRTGYVLRIETAC
jgi:hypothetical protein